MIVSLDKILMGSIDEKLNTVVYSSWEPKTI